MVVRATIPRLSRVKDDTDATHCPCYAVNIDATGSRGPRRRLALGLISESMRWAPKTYIPLRDDYSDALAVVDALHEWRHGDGPEADIVAAHEEYEAGQ
jgi:hypothetical protein